MKPKTGGIQLWLSFWISVLANDRSLSFSAGVGGVKCGDNFGSTHLELAHEKFSKVVLLKKAGPLQYSLEGAAFHS